MTYSYSASAIERYERCPRLFLYDYVWRFPSPERQVFTFGTRVHDVIQRYLESPDGVTPGDADLYPDGWDAGLSQDESLLVKKLVTTAISQGVVSKIPGRQVEVEFAQVPLVSDPQNGDIFVNGRVDLVTPDGITDHKTTKRDYALSKNALKKNTQLLLYAQAFQLDRIADNLAPLPEVTLRHNYLHKDTQEARAVETKVTMAELDAKWQEIQATCTRMRDLAIKYPTPEHWLETPAADDRVEACNKYGGCAYMKVCGGITSAKEYLLQIKRQHEQGEKINGHWRLDDLLQSAPDQRAVSLPPDIQENPQQDWIRGEDSGKKNTLISKLAASAHGAIAHSVTNSGGPVAGIFDGKLARRASASSSNNNGNHTGVSTLAPPVTTGTPPINPPPMPSEAAQASNAPQPRPAHFAPWANIACTACAGTGFNSRAAVCRICKSWQVKQIELGSTAAKPGVNPEWFETGSETRNGVVWVYWEGGASSADAIESAGVEISGEFPLPVPGSLVNQAPVNKMAAAPVGASVSAAATPATELPATPAVPTNAPVTPPVPAPAATSTPGSSTPGEEPKRRGRPRQVQATQSAQPLPVSTPGPAITVTNAPLGFMLIINCGFQTSSAHIIRLESVFARYAQQLALEKGQESYYALEPFIRRDAMAQLAGTIAAKENWNGKYVLASTSDPDMKTFVNALRVHATDVIVPENLT